MPGLESGRGRERGAAASSDAADLETCPDVAEASEVPADDLDIDTLAAMLEDDLDADEAGRRQKDVDEAFAAMYGDQASADETGSNASSVPAELFDAANLRLLQHKKVSRNLRRLGALVTLHLVLAKPLKRQQGLP